MHAAGVKQSYSRAEVRRLLGVSDRRLRSWREQGFLASSSAYSFSDLVALRTLCRLRAQKVSTRTIARALRALRQKLGESTNPLTELKLFSDRGRIRVQTGGQTMEPISGQLLFDFGEEELQRLVEMRPVAAGETPAGARQKQRLADEWFQKGVDLEQRGGPAEEAEEAYRRALELDPGLAGALVNLGTIHFNARRWEEAERCYRQSLEATPGYALAHFNLGNLFDERGEHTRAVFHYQAALNVDAAYADAHYNLALLYQSSGESLAALHHWKQYLKLDSTSEWGAIARRELERLYAETVVRRPESRP